MVWISCVYSSYISERFDNFGGLACMGGLHGLDGLDGREGLYGLACVCRLRVVGGLGGHGVVCVVGDV